MTSSATIKKTCQHVKNNLKLILKRANSVLNETFSWCKEVRTSSSHGRGKRKKRKRLWMIYQRLRSTLISPPIKAMLKENPLKPVQLCLQQSKDYPPRIFWSVVDIVPQVQLRNAHLVFLRLMNQKVIPMPSEVRHEKEGKHEIDSRHNSLEGNNRWGSWILPGGRNAIPVKWIKLNAESKVCKCKGFMQREGVHFSVTFAPFA